MGRNRRGHIPSKGLEAFAKAFPQSRVRDTTRAIRDTLVVRIFTQSELAEQKKNNAINHQAVDDHRRQEKQFAQIVGKMPTRADPTSDESSTAPLNRRPKMRAISHCAMIGEISHEQLDLSTTHAHEAPPHNTTNFGELGAGCSVVSDSLEAQDLNNQIQ